MTVQYFTVQRSIIDGDSTADINGIKFVVESEVEVALKSPEIVKQGDRFVVKSTSYECSHPRHDLPYFEEWVNA